MNHIKDGAFTIPNILSDLECAMLIDRAETIGFAAATVSLATGAQLMTGVRNNDRVKFEDSELAHLLETRLENAIRNDNARARLNERFAVYRYDPGQRFKRHQDGVISTDDGLETSRQTVLVYLNQDCEGGETVFSDVDRSGSQIKFLETPVTPETGMALIFDHELWHEGKPVTAGRKYVLRTDILYPKN
jgi:predicted 2-oxoglutarate/Fe(II)-dependent dioxygenase YbiX